MVALCGLKWGTTVNIENKNTLQVIETQTGVTLIMLDANANEPTKGQQYFYVVWNAKRGFFVWSNVNCDERHNINDENVYRN